MAKSKAEELAERFGTSGGFAEEMTFEIRDAHFIYDVKYQDGTIPLLEIVGLMDGEKELSQRYPVGKGFTVVDDGGKIAREDGEKKQPNKSTAYGRFLEGFLECDGVWDYLATLPEDVDVMCASMWEGLTLHLVNQEQTFNIPGQDPVKSNRMVPDAIVATPKGATAAKGKAEVKGQAALPDVNVIGQEQREALTKLAAISPTFEEFIGAAYKEGIVEGEHEDFISDDGDKGFYALMLAEG